MKVESIRLKNFRVFKDVTIKDIPAFCVVVGANGTGKSTLFNIFGFLKNCLMYNVSDAVFSMGGYHELVSRGMDDENILIELKFCMDIAGKERLVTYHLEIARKDNKVVIAREILRYKRSSYGSPYHFLDFAFGKGYAILNEDDFNKKDEELQKDYQEMNKPDILAIKGLGQFQRFKAANAFRQLIENWHISDFHINDARGSKDAAGPAEHLSISGDNLQLVANRLYNEHPDIFRKILERMKKRVPGITAIEPQPTLDGKLLLKFQDGSFTDPFIDKYVSDGTIKMFAYLLLLYDPQPYPLLCVEEPENQLYPSLLAELAEEFRLYANRGGQVFVSSHSPDFLNAVLLEEVFWFVKDNGFTQIRRAKDDLQIAAYMNDGDKMGYLWEQGLFTGAGPA